ncbi:putative phospholipase A1 [Andreprevotia sp. IGB-42]|uniref:phospholipase A n=1 Tax=Andreprevotia sp. IGB-42 TaxID=2497473 RepID=UPI00135BD108|nr:phospholipase A [Andreprevotia sp. IGB-42]KAF0813214.1 putative phospholipase A1 [Andreprevotia sp. IGB-42]
MRPSQPFIAGTLLMSGLCLPALAAETVFLPAGEDASVVDVLFVNRGQKVEAFTPPASLVCPTDKACVTSSTGTRQIQPESASMVRYTVVKPADGDATTAAAQPANTTVALQDQQLRNTTLSGYAAYRFSGYEPMYFLINPNGKDARFQFSFKYQFVDPESDIAARYPWLAGMRFAYTQSSLWNIGEKSSAFYDTSYRPELYYEYANVAKLPGVSRFDIATGYRHESNGKEEGDSRSFNQLFVRPTFIWGDPQRLNFVFSPSINAYIGDLSDNPDIKDYRGYVDWRFRAGEQQGWQAGLMARTGKSGKGAFQLDLSYPLNTLLGLDLYGYLQYWNGYGETLRTYDRRTESVRVGISLVR